MGLLRIHFLYIAPLLFGVSSLIMLIASRSGAAPDAEVVKAYVWSRADFTEESEALATVPFYANYRYLSVALLALTAWIVGAFW